MKPSSQQSRDAAPRSDGLLVDVEMPRGVQAGSAEGEAGLVPRSEGILVSAPALPGGAVNPDRAFDRDAFLARLGGDLELLETTVAHFLSLAAELEQQVRQSVARGDGGALALVAHSVKGVAATFEARPLVAEARRLELLGRDGDMDGALQAFPDFQREMRRLVEALGELETA